jgi:PAS domain-containing protein
MCYTRTLPQETAARLAAFELALRCRQSVGGCQVGDLFVAAEEIALLSLQDAVPVLAGQAASMLEHITLNREINQREAYFRTLVLNAADVVLIVDAGNRITYTSPSAVPVFGTAELVDVDLLDLVTPEQRADVGLRSTRSAPVNPRPTCHSGRYTVRTANWPRSRS